MQRGHKKESANTKADSVSKRSRNLEIEELRAALGEKEALYLRTLAEFDNFRKRVAREGETAAKAKVRELLLGIIAIHDSFDRAFLSEATKAEPQVYQGMRSIQRQIYQLLELHKVMSYESIGQPFDPSLHEAIDTEPSQKFPEGIVLREIQKGYVWQDKVLRPAKVIVVRDSKIRIDELA